MPNAYPPPRRGQPRGKYRAASDRRAELVGLGLDLLSAGVLPSMLSVRDLTGALGLTTGAFWNTFPSRAGGKIAYLHAVLDAYREHREEAWRVKKPGSITSPRRRLLAMAELAEDDRMRAAVDAWRRLSAAARPAGEGRPGPVPPAAEGASDGADYAGTVLADLEAKILRETERALAEWAAADECPGLVRKLRPEEIAVVALGLAPWLGGPSAPAGDTRSFSTALDAMMASAPDPAVLTEVQVSRENGKVICVFPDRGREMTDAEAAAAAVAAEVFPDLVDTPRRQPPPVRFQPASTGQ